MLILGVKGMEWEQMSPDVEIRQGDLLIERNSSTGQIENTLLVITADCDISKGKFGSYIAALRITPLPEYVTSNWATTKLSKKIADHTTQLHQVLIKHHGKLLQGVSSLTVDAVINWIQQETAAEICLALALERKDSTKLTKTIENYLAAITCVEEHETPLERLARINSVYNGSDVLLEISKLIQSAQNEVFPEDTFILSDIPNVSAQGGVVMLRELVGVHIKSIKYRLSEVAADSDVLRTHRLIPQIKYAISQSFGALYSRIGLSKEYENQRKATIQNLTNYKWI